MGLWCPKRLHARACAASRICVNNLRKVIIRELTMCTDNIELFRTAKIKAGSTRYNLQSMQGSIKESIKHSAELADKN